MRLYPTVEYAIEQQWPNQKNGRKGLKQFISGWTVAQNGDNPEGRMPDMWNKGFNAYWNLRVEYYPLGQGYLP